MFGQRHQDSYLVMRDTSGISLRLGRTVGQLLDMRRETQWPFPVATGIMGLLLIFKRSQSSSPFEASNSTCLSRCEKDVRPPVEMRQGTTAFSRVSTENSDIPSSCEMKHKACIQITAGKSGLLLSQGISVCIPLEAANSGFLPHNCYLENPHPEVFVESWHTSCVEARESALISR